MQHDMLHSPVHDCTQCQYLNNPHRHQQEPLADLMHRRISFALPVWQYVMLVTPLNVFGVADSAMLTMSLFLQSGLIVQRCQPKHGYPLLPFYRVCPVRCLRLGYTTGWSLELARSQPPCKIDSMPAFHGALQHQLQRLSRACFLPGEVPLLGSTDLLRREALLSASVCS